MIERGVVLESSHAMPKRLQRVLVEDGPFDCVIVLGGSNDLWTGDADRICESLETCHAGVRIHGASLGIVTLPPFEPSVMRWLSWTGILEKTDATRNAVNARLRACAVAADTVLVDLAQFADADVMVRSDGLHFERGGYERLGEEAAMALAALPDLMDS